MKRKIYAFTGSRPVFSGSPAIVPGGFNLDSDQNLSEDATIPEGTLAIADEQLGKVKLFKTAVVSAIDSVDAKKITLKVTEFFAPLFVVGEKVLKSGAISGAYADAPTINKVTKSDNSFSIELSAVISGLAVNDVLEVVVSKNVTIGAVIAGVFSLNEAGTTLFVTPGLSIAANDKLMQNPLAADAAIANAVTVTSYDPISGKLVIAAAITNLEAGDSLIKVYADGTDAVSTVTEARAAEIGIANSVVVSDTDKCADETPIDVTMDTMQYALYARRVAPIPASQIDESGRYLKGNCHVKLTQSY